MQIKHSNYVSVIFLVLCIGLENVHAQLIHIRQGTVVQVDGTIGSTEWSDADSILIDLNTTQKVTVKFKHDGSNFNFTFLNNLESFNIRFPEILFDINNDKSLSWQNDDWWFHVSATDCESNTAANDYSNCLLVQPDWLAVNNFQSGPPMTDTVEIQIPFTKVNFNSTFTDTIGIAFDVTNTFSAWNYWPDPLVDVQIPTSWGNAIVEFNTSGLKGINDPTPRSLVISNPVEEILHLTFYSPLYTDRILRLRDIRGQVIRTIKMNNIDVNDKVSVPVGSLSPGMYFLECHTEHRSEIIKFIKL
jgi:hypothetical protein